MILSRDTVVRAIQTEPLGAVGFFAQFTSSGECRYCAVGALIVTAMRKEKWAVKTSQDLDNIDKCGNDATNGEGYLEVDRYNTWVEARREARGIVRNKTRSPLSALSGLYEFGIEKGIPMHDLRKKLATFVNNEFPDFVMVPTVVVTNKP